MEIGVFNNDIIIKNPSDFNLEHVFDCGQCFRFYKTGENEYTGVAGGRAVTVKSDKNSLIFYDTTKEDFDQFWHDYFDLSLDYTMIKNKLSGDRCMDNAMNEGHGIRILRQELFETIISFIISQSNNIPRIKKIIESLCTLCGEKLEYRGKTYYSFPTPQAILSCDISSIKAGFRDKYIIAAAKHIHENPTFLDDLKAADTPKAKKMLMSLPGIGNKVSDCILLFGLGKTDSFPVDVWMRRIMEQLYFERKSTVEEITEYAREKFGEFSGYAQQYLFYYALNHKSDFKEDIL